LSRGLYIWPEILRNFTDAAATEFDEESVMTSSMDGFNLDEDSEEGNMFDESSLASEDDDDFFDFENLNSDEL
jgi:hypothetical protein